MGARTGFTLALLLVLAVLCLGATLWIHRGFRARSTPAASEAYFARKIRNFAIPASERRSKNALDATAGNLQQARELFVEHCASCHGLDGGASMRKMSLGDLQDPTTNNVAPFTKDQVALVYGSLWKQRYFTKVGDDYFPLGAQWEVKNKKWSKYHVADNGDWWVPFYGADNSARHWRERSPWRVT